MSDQLSAAAANLGIPEALVQRSAAARAAETGTTTDAVIAAWAGGTEAPTAAPAATTTEAVEPSPAPTPTEPVKAAQVSETAAVIAAPSQGSQGISRAPIPDEVTPGEAAHLPEVITVPTVGIRERTNFVIPKWLTGAMLIVPLFALFALGGASTGECGEATELSTDVITGEIVNCDGSTFTGSQIGGGGTDYVALGGEIYAGAAVAGVNCAGCHGGNGQGVGNFPPMTGVETTFGSCNDQVEWVSLGSTGFQSNGETTYGDTGKTIAGGMPGFASSLSDEQIAAVTAFERVQFGGGDEAGALADCGLAEESPGTEGDTSDAGTDSGEDVEASSAHSG